MIPVPAPIVQAYVQTGALSVPCSTCAAKVGNYCTSPTGQLRRVPCARRCRVSSDIPDTLDPRPRADAAETLSAPDLDQPTLDYPDPSEPRHPRGDE